MDQQQRASENLTKARAYLATTADNAEIHANGCPQCNMGHQPCQTARFWADQAKDAAWWVGEFQKILRRATLAAS